MSKVFVLDTNFKQLNPIHPGRARMLLSSGKAAVYRRFPFTLILKTAVEAPAIEPLRVKIDPGAKTTGMAVINDTTGEVVFAAEIAHRGFAIKSSLDDRRSLRRGRRNRKTRYRAPRFYNRPRHKGWLAPSLQSRIANVTTWTRRIMRICPIDNISMELVKFDLQKMENPEISGAQYQQGTLAGYEAREYLLEKWKRACTYCGQQNTPLQVEHIIPKAKYHDNRISNLCLACDKCNKAKGTKDIKDFLQKKTDLLKKILAQAKAPLKDAAAVNATRWELFRRLEALGLPIECGSGGLTKYNRTTRELEKTHWIDAACVGKSTPETIKINGVRPLLITAMGSGNRHVQGIDGYGFPVKVGKDERAEYANGRLSGKERHKQPELMRQKVVSGKIVPRPIRRIGKDMRETITPRGHKRIHGFQTGDMVRVAFPDDCRSKHHGKMFTGRIAAAKASGSFTMYQKSSKISFSYKYATPIHKHDGYQYA